MPLFRALAKNMAASYFGKKVPYGFVMEVTLLYVFILCSYPEHTRSQPRSQGLSMPTLNLRTGTLWVRD